jgi:hypothetical protein
MLHKDFRVDQNYQWGIYNQQGVLIDTPNTVYNELQNLTPAGAKGIGVYKTLNLPVYNLIENGNHT